MSNELPANQQEELAVEIRRAFSVYRAPVRDIEAAAPKRSIFDRPALLAVSTTAAAIVLVVVASLVVDSLAQPQSTYASWTAVPTSPDQALAVIATDRCRKGMGLVPPDPTLDRAQYEEERRRMLAEYGDISALPLAAQDQRGRVALAFFTDGRTYASCVVTGDSDGGATALSIGTIDGERSGALRVLSNMSHEGEPPLRTVIGDVAPAVSNVAIQREDGVTISATVTNGYFLAWWPTGDGITGITAHDEQGDVLGSLTGDIFD